MADAIDNLAQDLNQATTLDEFPGYPGYQFGQEIPGMGGLRVGDPFYGYDAFGQEAPYNWKTGAFEFQPAPSSLGTSDVGFGNIDYNIRDQPVERINIGNTGEENAFVRGGTYLPEDRQSYISGVNVSIPPAGGTVDYLTPDQISNLISGQTPSVPEGIVTPSVTSPLISKTPEYSVPIGFMDNGDIIMANKNNIRDTIVVPSGRTVSQEDLEKGIRPDVSIPPNWNAGLSTAAPEAAVQPVGGLVLPSTAVTSSPGIGTGEKTGDFIDIPQGGDSWNATPGYVPPPPFDTDKKESSPWTIIDPNAKPPAVNLYPLGGPDKYNYDRPPNYGQPQDPDANGNQWVWDDKNPDWGYWKMATGTGTTTGGGNAGTGTGTGTGAGAGAGAGTGTGGSTGVGGGTTGTGGGYTGINFVRNPVLPVVRRETVIPSKPLREIALPERQEDPFAKLYADLLANSQQQQDQYRYINYDPDQIMNAAMRSFRNRSAMRSLQG